LISARTISLYDLDGFDKPEALNHSPRVAVQGRQGDMMTTEDSRQGERLVTAEMLEGLPEPVQRYLRHTGLVGKPWAETVYLKQRGRFRLGADQPWMPVKAEEWYTADPPSLHWKARFKMAGLPLVSARDRYEEGHGHMLGKVAGLFTVFDTRGPELDQAAMIRYLNEIMWFPSAFLGQYVTWQSVDDHSADAVFSDGGKSVSGRWFFDAEGRITNFHTKRYREIGGDFSLDEWSTPITSYGLLAGLNLPAGGQAVWHLPEGDLVYADLAITEVEHNTARAAAR
jgi:hypothetical protein